MPDDTLASSFQRTGDDYDRYRPGFPPESAEAIVPVPVRTALDLGAGTGKFTERLIARADHVIAVDPSERMLGVLRAKLPGVEAHVGTAEKTPVPDASVDVVTVAQAFHWFDEETACAEIRRVLVPGGTLGLLWNGPDPDCAWDRACYGVAHPWMRQSPEPDADEEHGVPGFELRSRRTIPWAERLTRPDYLARWHTVSTFLTATPPERDRMTAEIEHILDTDPATAGREEFDLPLVTDVFMYRAG